MTVPNIGAGVPVTAKLSKKFYQTLGEDVANEMVDWFNAVDATYRADLRELNESNFLRFEAKLEQRLAELDARWVTRAAGLDQRIAEVDAKLERRLAEFKAEISQQLAKLETGLVRWMFTFWITTALAIVALLIRR